MSLTVQTNLLPKTTSALESPTKALSNSPIPIDLFTTIINREKALADQQKTLVNTAFVLLQQQQQNLDNQRALFEQEKNAILNQFTRSGSPERAERSDSQETDSSCDSDESQEAFIQKYTVNNQVTLAPYTYSKEKEEKAVFQFLRENQIKDRKTMRTFLKANVPLENPSIDAYFKDRGNYDMICRMFKTSLSNPY